LTPRVHTLEWALLWGERPEQTLVGCKGSCRGEAEARTILGDIALQFALDLDAIAMRVPYGGPEFATSAIATPEVIGKLEALQSQAPLHLPLVVSLVRAAWETFQGTPVVLCFETGFFTALPLREQVYAVDEEATGMEGLRRYGYHGIYHHGACVQALSLRQERGRNPMPKVLSICLEPRPEIAGAIGTRAVYITSGATPLEGLPGRTTCGEIDPSIVLTLAEDLKMGPEEIDAVLSRDSGITGLVGHRVTLEDVYTVDNPDYKLARDVMNYRMLMSAGAAIAVLGGVDVIVFSGRSAELGHIIGPWLLEHLHLRGTPANRPVTYDIFTTPLERLMADTAIAATMAPSPAN
jgi:acetate kinase